MGPKEFAIPEGATFQFDLRRDSIATDGTLYVSPWEGRFVRDGETLQTILFAAAAAPMGVEGFAEALDLHGRSTDLPLLRLPESLREPESANEPESSSVDPMTDAQGPGAVGATKSPWVRQTRRGRVELIGVAVYPSSKLGELKSNQWWRPDGRPLEDAPYYQPLDVRSVLPSWEQTYEFAFRVEQAETMGDAAILSIDGGSMYGLGRLHNLERQLVDGIIARTMNLPRHLEATTLTLGLPSSPRTPWWSQKETPHEAVVFSNVALRPRVELVLRDAGGRALPESLEPIVVASDDIRELLRKSGPADHRVPLGRLDAGRFRVEWDGASPLHLFINEPGFLRGFYAGPFEPEALASGRIEIDLPMPGRLAATIRPDGVFQRRNDYTAAEIGIRREMPHSGIAGPSWYLLSRSNGRTEWTLELDDLAPGNYSGFGWLFWNDKRCMPADGEIVAVVGGGRTEMELQYNVREVPYGEYGASITLTRPDATPVADEPVMAIYTHNMHIPVNDWLRTDGRGHVLIQKVTGGEEALEYELHVGHANKLHQRIRGRQIVGRFKLSGNERVQAFEFVVPEAEDEEEE